MTGIDAAYPTARQRQRPNTDLLGLLGAAREELRDADEAAAAERRILGALVSGCATLRADLAPADFFGDGHAVLFAAIVALGVRVRPSARRDPALRRRAAHASRPSGARRAIYIPAYRSQVERWLAVSATLRDRVERLRSDPRPVFLRDYDTGRGVDRNGPMSHAWVLATWLNTGAWPGGEPRHPKLFEGV